MTCDLKMHPRWRLMMDVAETWNIPPDDAEEFLIEHRYLEPAPRPPVLIDA